jgi:cytochrome b6-f complex iron-sulfur subunit
MRWPGRTVRPCTPSRGVWHTVAAAADLPEGAVRDFDLGAVAGFVSRESGRLRAVSGMCTHQACRLALDEARTALVCPCHGATFAVAGTALHNDRSPRPLPPLPRLAVREHRGSVQVYGPAAAPPARA